MDNCCHSFALTSLVCAITPVPSTSSVQRVATSGVVVVVVPISSAISVALVLIAFTDADTTATVPVHRSPKLFVTEVVTKAVSPPEA